MRVGVTVTVGLTATVGVTVAVGLTVAVADTAMVAVAPTVPITSWPTSVLPDPCACVSPTWPTDRPQLSERDLSAPSLAQAREQGLLPEYAACTEYVASLRRA